MSKNWSLFLVVAFVLGFALKSYLDLQGKVENEATPPTHSAAMLYGQDGQAVNIFDTEDTRIRVVYFGFTRCPDVCPTSLAMLSGALNELDDATKAKLRPMFISLDPERDDAKLSAQYAHYFHPMIEGLSSSLEVTTETGQTLRSHFPQNRTKRLRVEVHARSQLLLLLFAARWHLDHQSATHLNSRSDCGSNKNDNPRKLR